MTVITEICSSPVSNTSISTYKIQPSSAEAEGKFETEGYPMVLNGLRETFKSGKTLPYKYRMEQLKSLQRLMTEASSLLLDALHDDLRKPKMEGSGELLAVEVDIWEALRCLQKWMTPEQLPNNLLFPRDRSYLKPDPYGVVLILGAFNYPIMLTLLPLVGAIAAGNCAVIKPSELASSTAMIIGKLIPKYLDTKCYQVIQGGLLETTQLLNERFDYIFSTSSTRVGKCIMQAAAKHLTPVTLELGGKSPVYIHDSADMEVSVKRILWGKMSNVGQTCIAPDYIICSKRVEQAFVELAGKILEEWYGSKLKDSSDISRIINQHHFTRLKRLLLETKGDVVIGGDSDAADLWISPTLVVNVQDRDVLMEEEIFGPILPFVRAESAIEAVNYLNHKKSKPLALYVFSRDKGVDNLFMERTSSGAMAINEVVLQAGWNGLPFGGVQDSGMGSYRGRYSFDTFSHRKSVLARDFSFVTEKLSSIRYPPYESTELKMKFLRTILKQLHLFKLPSYTLDLSHLFMFLLGVWVVMIIRVACTGYWY